MKICEGERGEISLSFLPHFFMLWGMKTGVNSSPIYHKQGSILSQKIIKFLFDFFKNLIWLENFFFKLSVFEIWIDNFCFVTWGMRLVEWGNCKEAQGELTLTREGGDGGGEFYTNMEEIERLILLNIKLILNSPLSPQLL